MATDLRAVRTRHEMELVVSVIYVLCSGWTWGTTLVGKTAKRRALHVGPSDTKLPPLNKRSDPVANDRASCGVQRMLLLGYRNDTGRSVTLTRQVSRMSNEG